MILDFDKIEEVILPHFRGGEKETAARLHADESGKIMLGRLIPGASIGFHQHLTNSEIIYILSGSGKALYDDGAETVGPGLVHYCPKGHGHGLINDGVADLVFFAVIPNQ